MKKAEKLYFLACCFPPIGRGNAVTNSCVANALADYFEVEVICIAEPRGVFLSYHQDESLVAGLNPSLTVTRIKAARWLGFNEILYAIGLLPCYYLNWAWRVWRKRKGLFAQRGAVFAVYPVFSDVLLGYILHRSFGYPLIVDFRDDFSGVMARGWRRALRGYYRWLENRIVSASAHITVTTDHLRDALITRYGVPPEKISVVLNVVPSAGRQKWAGETQSDGCRVIYAGAISAHQRPEVLLQAYQLLRQQAPEVAAGLRVVIYGPDSGYFRRHVAPHLTDGIHYGGFRPHEEIIQEVAASDIGFLCLGDAALAYATPTKFFEYIDLGKPILAVLPAGVTRKFIEEMELGLVAGLGDETLLAQHLRTLCEDRSLVARYAENVRNAKSRFSDTTQLQKWIGVVSRYAGPAAAKSTMLHP